jgi:hypothetical protein
MTSPSWRPLLHIGFRNSYHGCFWQIIVGPLVMFGGRGTYD